MNSFVVLLIFAVCLEMTLADPVYKVCTSSELKTLQAEICSSVYKRGRHSKITFNSYGFHQHRTKRKFTTFLLILPLFI